MCGICGYVGSQPAAPILRSMLKVMEDYGLGYESTGMATVENGKIALTKNVGKVNAVFPENGSWRRILKGSVGIAHTRYPSKDAPVGKPQFAHPFLGCDGHLVLIHNGTVANHEEIRLSLGNHMFSSVDAATGKINDSEAILHLLEESLSATANSEADIVAAVANTCRRLAQNTANIYLFAFIHPLHPSTIFAASGSDHENKRKITVASKAGFGTLFASYRDTGIGFNAMTQFVDSRKDEIEVLDYDVLAILRKDGYKIVHL